MASKDYLRIVQEAEAKRTELTKQQAKYIKDLYKDVARDLKKQLSSVKEGTLTERWLKDYAKSLQKEIKKIDKLILENIKEGVVDASMLFDNTQLDMFLELDKKFELGLGPTFTGMFSKPNPDVVMQILKGDLYKDNRGLSDRIWSYTKKTNKDIQHIITKGIEGKKSYFDIAKDLEKYVNPAVKKDFNWKKIYPKSNKVVDFNAYRLASTSISHAYSQALKESCKKNPYTSYIQWLVANNHRVCELCAERNGTKYKVDDLPMDHPLGQCSMVPLLDKELEDIGAELRDWVDGKENAKLDNWFKENGLKEPKNNNDISKENKEYSKNDINNTLKQIDKKYHDGILEKINNGNSLESKTFVNLSGKFKFMVDELPVNFYDLQTKEIVVNLARDSKEGLLTFFHETGHSIDNITDGYFYSTDEKYGFKKALKQDIKNYTKKVKAEFKEQYGHAPDENDIWDFVNIEKNVFGGDELRHISDIVSGASNGLFEGDYTHDTSYWRKKGMLENEAFADMYSTYVTGNDEIKALLEEVFTTSTKVYKEMITDILKEVK